jgi:hypothetical protein
MSTTTSDTNIVITDNGDITATDNPMQELVQLQIEHNRLAAALCTSIEKEQSLAKVHEELQSQTNYIVQPLIGQQFEGLVAVCNTLREENKPASSAIAEVIGRILLLNGGAQPQNEGEE